MVRYIYLDETEFQIKNETWIGYGALITNKVIENDIIQSALKTLEQYKNNNDKDYNVCDDRTLERKYFHASEDYACAHSAICRQIENIDGEFCVELVKSTNQEDLMQRSIWASIAGLNSPEKTYLIYENRTNLKDGIIKKHVDLEHRYIIHNMSDMMYMPLYFPELYYTKVEKNNAGMQITDFILWAYQRSLSKDDNRWLKLVETNSRVRPNSVSVQSEMKPDNDCFYTFTINKGIIEYTDQIKLYGEIKIHDLENLNDFIIKKILKDIFIELYILHLRQIVHSGLKAELEYAINNIEKSAADLYLSFLHIFDMVTFISNKNTIEVNGYWLSCKKLVAECFNPSDQTKWSLRHEQFDRAWNELKQEQFFNKVKSMTIDEVIEATDL